MDGSGCGSGWGGCGVLSAPPASCPSAEETARAGARDVRRGGVAGVSRAARGRLQAAHAPGPAPRTCAARSRRAPSRSSSCAMRADSSSLDGTLPAAGARMLGSTDLMRVRKAGRRWAGRPGCPGQHRIGKPRFPIATPLQVQQRAGLSAPRTRQHAPAVRAGGGRLEGGAKRVRLPPRAQHVRLERRDLRAVSHGRRWFCRWLAALHGAHRPQRAPAIEDTTDPSSLPQQAHLPVVRRHVGRGLGGGAAAPLQLAHLQRQLPHVVVAALQRQRAWAGGRAGRRGRGRVCGGAGLLAPC